MLFAAASLAALAACSSSTNDQASDTNVMMANDSLMANDMATGADDMNAMDNGAAALPNDAASFIRMASASDLYEIKSSKLALDTTKDKDIRDFAQMMITDHTKTTQGLKDAAAKANLTVPPPELSADQQQMLDSLQPLKDGDFDTAYLTQQMTGHQKALALMQNYAESGDTPALQDAAKTAIPIIQKHLARLQELAKQGG